MTTFFNEVMEIYKIAKTDSEGSQSSQETDSSQPGQKRIHLNRSLGLACYMKLRNATRSSSMLWSMSTEGTEIRKMWLTLNRRTLSFLSTENNWEKHC